jgi:hypothetical protein
MFLYFFFPVRRPERYTRSVNSGGCVKATLNSFVRVVGAQRFSWLNRGEQRSIPTCSRPNLSDSLTRFSKVVCTLWEPEFSIFIFFIWNWYQIDCTVFSLLHPSLKEKTQRHIPVILTHFFTYSSFFLYVYDDSGQISSFTKTPLRVSSIVASPSQPITTGSPLLPHL